MRTDVQVLLIFCVFLCFLCLLHRLNGDCVTTKPSRVLLQMRGVFCITVKVWLSDGYNIVKVLWLRNCRSGNGVNTKKLSIRSKETQYDFVECHTSSRNKRDKRSNIRPVFRHRLAILSHLGRTEHLLIDINIHNTGLDQ